ncbi:hypothetical protein C0993_004507 [Termitomyces sp. T159_Od127]|nr:hypothetical protein C0993_004507 [Termitomyces sp. T159_Od127]
MLTAMPLRLLLSICLTLFNGSSTSTGDIIHYMQTTLTFANGQWQDFQLLVTHLHASTPLILGLPWLHSTNTCINWQHLTLHFDRQTPEHSEPIPFNVTILVSATNHSHTLLQLHLKFAWLFVIDARLSNSPQVLTTLIDSRATSTFVSQPATNPQDLALASEL